MKPLVIRPRAELEMFEAAIYFEEQSIGLGAKFVDDVDERLRRIAEMPTAYSFAYRSLRRISLARFPYSIYYVDHADAVIVGTIVDARRDPRLIYERIRRDL